MINKTFYKGFINLISSNNSRKIDTIFNYALAYLKFPVVTHPLEIQIEPSAICNLKCKMCTLNKSTFVKKFLTPNDLSIILDKFRVRSVNLTGMGETLLNPYFEELLKICFDRHIKISFITNIQLLSKKHLDAIKKYPPTSISVSIESGYPKKYNQIRAGADYKNTITKIINLQKIIKSNSLNTEVIINLVYLDFNLKNLNHLKKIIRLASTLHIKKITSQNIHILSPYIKKLYQTKKIKIIFNELKKYAQSKNIDFVFTSTTISKGKCYYPWVYPQITATGEILPCCVIPQFGRYNDIVNKYSFGNILTDSLNKTWNGKKARKFRQSYQNNPFCKNCTKNKGIL